jgi:hypothetical protein
MKYKPMRVFWNTDKLDHNRPHLLHLLASKQYSNLIECVDQFPELLQYTDRFVTEDYFEALKVRLSNEV